LLKVVLGVDAALPLSVILLVLMREPGWKSNYPFCFPNLEANMPRLNAPTRIVFVVTLFLAVLALISFFFMAFPQNSQTAFWTAMAAYVGLALGCVMKGV
jgi:uncharacterized membrane protein